jgi:hypothetical protein
MKQYVSVLLLSLIAPFAELEGLGVLSPKVTSGQNLGEAGMKVLQLFFFICIYCNTWTTCSSKCKPC